MGAGDSSASTLSAKGRHISAHVTQLCMHISTQAAKAAVELLNKPAFVDGMWTKMEGRKEALTS